MLLRPFGLTAIASIFLLGGCALGPDFIRPKVETPSAFREAPKHWKVAEPRDLETQSTWWEIFGDPQLDKLVQQATGANQTILAADANYRQALAVIGSSRAALFPNLGSSVSNSRGQSAGTNGAIANTRTTDRVALSSAWELDIWGRLRRTLESSISTAEATADDLAAARLSVQSTLVQSYLQLRINDAQQSLLERTLTIYRRSHEITRNRYQAGVASQADVAQAETQLLSTEAQLVDLGIQRAQLEHAIAALTGKLPSDLLLERSDRVPNLPEVPLVVPSALLERRPDIAAAERRVAAANAQIGVAQAAFFPSLTLSASGGYQNSSFADILSAPYRFWSVGPALALPLFDAGARSAAKEQAIAGHDRSVATYRQTVLTAFQEVEDNLAALRILSTEKEIQKNATRAANEFQTLTNNQYLAGTVSFLNVATAQAAALSAERSSLDILNRQLIATVGLVKALGGESSK
ncbi:efflux transporter outer membrane subunit [Dechloromonas denitrificans]|uniref:efflux transporter outer membrane subunit n=1 Tax=Dechloromonas denitrificans TaxID=281362 RepID=UPI001CF8E731|nr:efflux transporter outer membrane subunit [Dechloromonas denitrificans]UCV05586.1 efflux transporter outer membrane subunit [Dechloromonas denitrificans]UCV09934.1 efflux transporter outer membrane subunit [Dechloromonas denitrificans]